MPSDKELATACADTVKACMDALEGLHRRVDAYTARRADAFAEQPTQDIRADDHRVVGGVKLDSSRHDATIYQTLRDKLGREPSGSELKAEVERIKTEGLQEQAAQGKLAHQRRR